MEVDGEIHATLSPLHLVLRLKSLYFSKASKGEGSLDAKWRKARKRTCEDKPDPMRTSRTPEDKPKPVTSFHHLLAH